MPCLTCAGRLDFLSQSQKDELNSFFRYPEQSAMPHQLAVLLGIEYSAALAILSVLQADGLSKNKLLIYHRCVEPPVGQIPFGTGLPDLPWICPQCEQVIENYDDLSFEIIAVAIGSIEFL